jgi:hypothetical protein
MEYGLLIIGFTITIMFYIMDNAILPSVGISRKCIVLKLENNKNRDLKLLEEIEEMIIDNQAWSLNAFPDSDVTYEEYIDALKEKYSIEYSDAEFKRLKSGSLSRRSIKEYIYKIKNQEEAITAFQMDLEYQKSTLQRMRAS